MAPGGNATPRRRVGAGPRAVERLLLEDVLQRLRDDAGDDKLLARPLRIVVPSRSLREHVSTALVRAAGHALVGVRVQTLFALASEILERSGGVTAAGDALLPIFVRRAAARTAELARSLEPLHDGYGIVAETVRDLLDADFEPDQAPELERLVAGDSREQRRAAALIEVTRETARSLEAAGLAWRARRLRHAAEHLERDAASALPSRAVYVHGFADATGVAGRLLQALVVQLGAVPYLDRPPDPLAPDRADGGSVFGARLNRQLVRAADPELDPGAVAPAPQLELLHAPGAQAEVRAVADRVANLLDSGVEPERIGIVARRLDPYVIPLRTQLDRVGVPFSGVGASAPADPARRRALGLAELLRRADETTADRWLGLLGERALQERRDAPTRHDLRVALHVTGASRLRDVARLDLDAHVDGRGLLTLPVRHGLIEREGESRAQRRSVARERLEALVDRARETVRVLEQWPQEAPLERHLARTLDLLERALGWRGADRALATATLAPLAEGAAGTALLAQREFVWMAERALAAAPGERLGGEGGGVQVLDATESRARTFEHLFVIGLNRDVFPRPIQEDPLLPDSLRARLAGHLPQIPLKRTGFDEERYLFAQLLASSPHVTLSWQTVDEDSRARPASPFVVRLRLGPTRPEPQDAPLLVASSPAPRTAHEHTLSAGLHGARADYASRLTRVLAADDRASDQAETRTRILDEVDPDLSTPEGRSRARDLGPYYGFLGAAADPADPRNGPLWITTAEAMARCPWQALLTRVLRVEQPPDALEALPALDARMVGNAVHAALERIVCDAGASTRGSLAEAADREPVAVAWPAPERLEAILLEAATDSLREEGAPLPGLARALAMRARAFVEAAHERGFEPGGGAVLGAELRGSVRPGASSREVEFKADRVDRVGGRLLLTDYKTGRPLLTARREASRRSGLLERVGRGEALQVVAYALAHREADGRYLYLKPDLDPELCVVQVRGDDTEVRAAFTHAFSTLIEAWERGSFFPRLSEPRKGNIPYTCEYCAVASACLHGDSGARARLARFTAEPRNLDPAKRALHELWRLPLYEPEPEPEADA